MSFKLFRVPAAAAIAVASVVIATAGTAEARDWLRAIERHYEAAEAAKYTPKGDNPQWDFGLDTVVNDMAWRARTARMLRNLPKPGQERRAPEPSQLADRPETAAPNFRF
jgi:hypothetical protein